MTKITLVVALLAALASALAIVGLVPALWPQALVALALCVMLFNVIGQDEQHRL